MVNGSLWQVPRDCPLDKHLLHFTRRGPLLASKFWSMIKSYDDLPEVSLKSYLPGKIIYLSRRTTLTEREKANK